MPRGTTDINTRLLVLLSEPTGFKHELLRARVDEAGALQGDSRIAVLDRMV